MRLFLYYVSHSLFNTLRKLMKTWVAFIVIALVFGTVVGLVARFFDKKEKKDSTEPSGTSVVQVDDREGPGEDISVDDAVSGKLAKSKIGQMMEEYNITKEQIVDLAISAVFLLILATNIINAQNRVTPMKWFRKKIVRYLAEKSFIA